MDNNSYKAITIQNIDSEDFVFEYNRAGGNPPYLIKAGEITTFPHFLANHAVKHLIDKILNKRDISTSNPIERERLASQIVIKQEDYHRVNPLDANQQLKSDIENMNKKNDLDSILDKRKADENRKPVEQPTPEKDALPELDTTDEIFEGLTPKPEEPKKEETGPLKEVYPEAKEPHMPINKPVRKSQIIPDKVVPTRDQLIKYAKDTLKMNVNEKALEKFKGMTDSELATELDYPMEGEDV